MRFTGFYSAKSRNTRNCVEQFIGSPRAKTIFQEAKQWQSKRKSESVCRAIDAQLIDAAAEKIVETAKHTGARVSGPIPLPTDREIVTVLRATHKYKDSREQFESRTHKRLIDILKPSNKTVEALMSLQLPAGVDIEIKL